MVAQRSSRWQTQHQKDISVNQHETVATNIGRDKVVSTKALDANQSQPKRGGNSQAGQQNGNGSWFEVIADQNAMETDSMGIVGDASNRTEHNMQACEDNTEMKWL